MSKSKTKKITSDMDGGWKEMIEKYLPDFLKFYFPIIHKHIDFNAGITFLDKEFEVIADPADAAKRIVDKLIKVQLKDKSVQWILLHIEVQSTRSSDFATRMFCYYYRIYDKYNRDVVSMALLLDDDSTFKPDRFEKQCLGCKLSFKFPIRKITEFKESRLGKSNLFALATQVQLAKMETMGNDQQRFDIRLHLTRKLFRAGFSRNDIINLYRFMDYIMTLPQDLATQYRQEVAKLEEAKKMPYVTSTERLAVKEATEKVRKELAKAGKKAAEKAAEKAIRENILDVLTLKFQNIHKSLIKKIAACHNQKQLKELHRQAVLAQKWQDVEVWLDQQ